MEYDSKIKINYDVFNMAESTSDGIYVIDKNGIVIAINNGYTEIAGVNYEEIVGRHIQDVWNLKGFDSDTAFMEVEQRESDSTVNIISGGIPTKETRATQDKSLVKNVSFTTNRNFTKKEPRPISLMTLEQKKKISVITTIERNNKTVLITGTPFFDEKGEVIQVITVLRDLTKLFELREKLEESEIEKKKFLKEIKSLKENEKHSDLIGDSSAMEKVRKMIEYVAKTDATVLITGETGSGKEIVARELYKNSIRKEGPYVKINCAAIPENLLEAELFGYEKGAFTGAQQKDKLGLFEIANKGTILLDEIGEMTYKLQSKLLRVLQEKEIKRIGGTSSISIDVRIIAATNQHLKEQIQKGEFREDLYYRLNVIPIVIPPLRERKEDIAMLSYNFLNMFNKKYHKGKKIDIKAVEILSSYDWPGNVRELENAIERLVIIGEENLIDVSDLITILGEDKFSYDLMAENKTTTLKEAVDLLEKNIIEKALKKYGSTHKAAKVLGIAQPTVVRKAKALGIKEW